MAASFYYLSYFLPASRQKQFTMFVGWRISKILRFVPCAFLFNRLIFVAGLVQAVEGVPQNPGQLESKKIASTRLFTPPHLLKIEEQTSVERSATHGNFGYPWQ